VHAFPTDGRLFEGLAGRLPGRLLAPDLPGFGDSPMPQPAPDILAVADLVDLLEAWLDASGLGRVVLGGVAIGGYLSIELVARRPDLARALVLIGCKPAPDAPSMADARESVARLALDEGPKAVADRLVDQPLAPDAPAEARTALRAMIEAADPGGIAGLVRGLARRPDPVPALGTVGVPTLVLGGSVDPFTKPEQGRALAALVPGSTYLELPGVGHLPPLEAPEATARAIGGFVSGLGR
jgi:pimeloyl-ACP methyl ester carboxylesterase